MKGSANDVYGFSFRDFFNNDTRRTLWGLLMQERGDGIQSREAPIYALNPAFGLNTHTGRVKGRGCGWA